MTETPSARKTGFRPPEESGVFDVAAIRRNSNGVDGLTVETREDALTPANRENARREAGFLIQALTEQAKSQIGETRRRTERELEAIVRFLKMLDRNAHPAAEDRIRTWSRRSAPRDQ
jgi:hypothetical protein